jgi:hypothetical protein
MAATHGLDSTASVTRSREGWCETNGPASGTFSGEPRPDRRVDCKMEVAEISRFICIPEGV